MKKLLLSICMLTAIVCYSQGKIKNKIESANADTLRKPKDSVFILTFSREQFFAFANYMASKIDSKKETDELLKFLEKNAALKPKE
jgi:MFS superfamily sulfate permease-like transporter